MEQRLFTASLATVKSVPFIRLLSRQLTLRTNSWKIWTSGRSVPHLPVLAREKVKDCTRSILVPSHTFWTPDTLSKWKHTIFRPEQRFPITSCVSSFAMFWVCEFTGQRLTIKQGWKYHYPTGKSLYLSVTRLGCRAFGLDLSFAEYKAMQVLYTLVHELWGKARLAFEPVEKSEDGTILTIRFWWPPANKPVCNIHPASLKAGPLNVELWNCETDQHIYSSQLITIKTSDPVYVFELLD